MKKILAVMLSLVLTALFVTPVMAEESNLSDGNQLSSAQIEKLKEIGEKYGVEIILPTDKTLEATRLRTEAKKKFDTVSELDQFISQLIAADKQTNGGEVILPKQQGSKLLVSPQSISTTYTDGHVSWYAALIGGTFSWKNIDYHYTVSFNSNGSGYISGVSNVTSYLTGVQIGLSWTQTGNNSFGSGSTAYLSVSGYYLVGAEVAGFPVGVKYHTTWEKNVTHSLPVLA